MWFTKGQGRITVAGVTRGYTAHNAIFIPAGVMHGFEVGPQVFGTAVFFGKDTAIPLPASPQLLRIREVHAQQEVNVILDMIQREMNSDSPAHDRATRHYLGLLGVWLERQVAKAAPEQRKPDAARRLVARYTALMERDFRSGAGVGDFAAALGVTPTHLTRCCRQACGRSAIDHAARPPHFRGAPPAGGNPDAGGPDRRKPWLHLARLFHPRLPAPDRQVAHRLPPLSV